MTAVKIMEGCHSSRRIISLFYNPSLLFLIRHKLAKSMILFRTKGQNF